MIGLGLSLSLGAGGRRGGGAPSLFALSQLPPGAVKMDLDPSSGVTLNGGTVSEIVDATGAITLAQATPSSQPAFVATYPAMAGKPVLTFDGTGDILSGTQLAQDTVWCFHVAERMVTNNVSTSDGRILFEFGRATGALRSVVEGLRSTVDAAQNQIRTNGAGATGGGAATPFGIDGVGHVITSQLEAAGGGSLSIDGNAFTSRRPTSGATTLAGSNLGGSTTSVVSRLGMKYARGLAVDYTLLPGGMAQSYNAKVLQGFLAWTYGTQASLPAAHPFKSAAPLASDWKDQNMLVQTWGNSITKGSSGSIGVAGDFTNKGLTVTNGGVGGNTTTQIKDRFVAGFNTGTGTTDGATTTEQRKRLTVIGEFWANGPTDTSGTDQDIQDRMFAELATMVAAVETAQGVAAGGAHLAIWDQWVTQGATITAGVPNASRVKQDAIRDRVRSTYPNYAMPVADMLIEMGSPTGIYPDPTNYALRIKPAVLDSDGLHPSALGYTEVGKIVYDWLKTKGWIV